MVSRPLGCAPVKAPANATRCTLRSPQPEGQVGRGGSGQGRVVLFPSLGTSAADLSVPCERKISGRPCVGPNPGRAAHRRKGTGGPEDWNDGTMEYWSDGLENRLSSPAFHSSIIPPFHDPPFHSCIVAPAGGGPLVPGSSGVLRARRASRRSSVRRKAWGPVQK